MSTMKADVTAENRPAYPENMSTLRSRWMRGQSTHEDQGGIQVFFVFAHKITIVLVGLALELVIELMAGSTGRSKQIWKESW